MEQVMMSRLREEDLPRVMDWRTRLYITKYMNTDPVLTLEGQKRWFQKVSADESQRHWIINCGGVPVGLISVFDIDRTNSRCSWGYYIAEREFRSLRLAMYLEWSLYDYVFDVLKLNKLCDETFVENAQVVKLHRLCGSKQDGVLRQHIRKNGHFYDVSYGSILASEWAEKREKTQYEKFNFE